MPDESFQAAMDERRRAAEGRRDEAVGEPKKQKKAGKVMREFAHGELHSGSKKGPVVTDPAQAKAIAMSESGQTRKK